MVQVLLRDQFVDAVDNVQIRVYIQQAHVQSLQEALARGLELESILRSIPRKMTSYPDTQAPFRARRGAGLPLDVTVPTSRRVSRELLWVRTARPQQEILSSEESGKSASGQYQYRPCCWHCGKEHLASSCPTAPPTVTAQDKGNSAGLEGGALNQPSPKRPQSI
ncbi:hypothetical protein O3P69_010932 [Scylla paramamosain]|uniref:Gag protein n=1 Tax=Scylla paramamosain TaxID=85552 RepID=A0AAW0SBA3_SCYPA